MNVYLDGSDAPPLMHLISVLQEVMHGGARLDVDNTLTDGAAAIAFLLLAVLASHHNLLLLHGSACLLLHHRLDGIIVLLEGDTLHIGCDIRFVVRT